MKNNQRIDDFLWGSATASYQCEGAWNEAGKAESMWDRYLHENHYENGDVASDHYHLFREDIRMMREGGQNAFRFSISWPRIIRNLEGEINEEGIQHYREVIDECISNGIEPFVTLYHWDLPQYLQELGGWLNRITCKAFAHYCDVVFQAFDGKVKNWSTFNEPKWFMFNGYMAGNYPPEMHSPQDLIQGCYNVMLANAMAIKVFRDQKIQGKVGLVMSHETFYGIDNSPECQQAVINAENYSNRWVSDTCVLGTFPPDLLKKLQEEGFNLSFMKEEELRIIRENTVDFLGVNYYSPSFVRPYSGGETKVIINNKGKAFKGKTTTIIKNWFELVPLPDWIPRNEWDMGVYPKGLYDTLVDSARRYHIPLYLTENGLGMYEDQSAEMIQDDSRIEYLRDHIMELLHAKDEGVDIRGYFVWSTFDLYSWKNGREKCYGLVSVDFDDKCKRKPKASYYWYKRMIENDWKEEE